MPALHMPTMKTTISWAILLSFVGPVIGQSTLYNAVREYSGSTFFDRWTYYGNVDNTTWGNVTYVDQATATANHLTFVNGAGNAIIQVDNTTTILPSPLVNRNSVRLTTTDLYGLGSLIIIDTLHIPYGCSVWPAFWTFGPEATWPDAGEIDIIEGINENTNNQVALHTTVGCYQANVTTQSGNTFEIDCSTPQGCDVGENKPNSYGASFTEAGGGVFALQYDASGANLWFFSRPDIPANIQQATTSSQMDTSTWGIPTASYPNTTCSMQTFFPPQQLVLLTTLCGDWAGVPSIYRSTCQTPTDSCVADNIIGNGSNYLNAYWEIRYIRTYLSVDDVSPTSTTSSEPGATSGATSSAPAVAGTGTTHSVSSANVLQSSIFSWVLSLLLMTLIRTFVYIPEMIISS